VPSAGFPYDMQRRVPGRHIFLETARSRRLESNTSPHHRVDPFPWEAHIPAGTDPQGFVEKPFHDLENV